MARQLRHAADSGPLTGVAVAFDSKIETWHPMFATGYFGQGKGFLLVPDSVELRPGKEPVGKKQ